LRHIFLPFRSIPVLLKESKEYPFSSLPAIFMRVVLLEICCFYLHLLSRLCTCSTAM
jgi:hypothetical protein